MDIENIVNKALKQIDFYSCNSGNIGVSGGGLSDRSNVIIHKCVKKVHFHKDCKSKENDSGGNLSNKSTNKLP